MRTGLLTFIRGLSNAIVLFASSVAAEPVAFWASDPVSPGNTVIVQGADLGKPVGLSVQRMADEGGPASIETASIDSFSEQSIKFTIPSNQRPGVFRADLSFSSGTMTVWLNRPTVYWAQGDAGAAATPGGWLRLMGRNIARSGAAWLLLQYSGGGDSIKLLPASGSLWDATFKIPDAMRPGHYAVTLYNGNGGAQSAVSVGDVQIDKVADPILRTVRVKPSGTDDTRQINYALGTLSRIGGGTVILAPGFFTISNTIRIPKRVSLIGTGSSNTIISLSDQVLPPEEMITVSGDTILAHLTLRAKDHRYIVSAGFVVQSSGGRPGNITIDDIVVRASMFSGHMDPANAKAMADIQQSQDGVGFVSVRLRGDNLRLIDSDILGSGGALLVSDASNVVAAGNKLYNGRYGWYSISRSSNVVFENNIISASDLQGTGGGINTMFAGAPASRNVLVKNNKLYRFFGWDREAITSDGPGGCASGKVRFSKGKRQAEIAQSRNNLDDDLETRLKGCVGGMLIVYSGAGAGQYAAVTAVHGATITVDRPFLTDSDAAAASIVGYAQARYLIVGNQFEDVGPAVQFFGTAVDDVIADNTVVRSEGLFIVSLDYQGLQPGLFVQFLNNGLKSGLPPKGSTLALVARPVAKATVPMIRGVVIRNNTFQDNMGIVLSSGMTEGDGISNVLIEGNIISGTGLGVSISPGVTDVLLRANRFRAVERDYELPTNANRKSIDGLATLVIP